MLAVALGGLGPAAAQAAPGDLDTTFDGDGKVTLDFGGGEDGAGDVALQPDGKIVVAGWDSDDNEFVLARYDAGGTLDTSFGGGDGIVTADLLSYGAIALMPDGSIMAAGGNGDFVLARFTSAGALDTTFGSGGVVQADFGGSDYAYDIAAQADGKLLLGGQGGSPNDFALARFNSGGTLDTGFGGGDGKVTTDFGDFGDDDWASALAVQQDGKIVAVGNTLFGGVPANESDFAVARYQPDGSLDTGFAGDGTTTLDFGGFDGASAVAIQPNGKVVVGGTGVLAGKAHVTLVRYLTNGSLDPGFGGGGIVTNDLGPFGSGVSDLVLQQDGRIVAGGGGGDVGEDFLIVRYNPSGSLDTTFGDGDGSALADFNGDSDWAHALVLQPDGKIVMVGQARNLGTFDDEFALARFEGGGIPPTEEEPEQPGEAPSQPLPPSGSSASPPSSATVQPGSSARLGLATAAGTAPIRGSTAIVRLRCGGQSACRGVAMLVALVRSVRKARRSARGAKSVVLGRSRFRVPAGKAKLLRIRLNRKGLQLVRQAGRRGFRARLAGRGLRSRTVRLKPASSSSKRNRRQTER